jgi:hypothetical protein
VASWHGVTRTRTRLWQAAVVYAIGLNFVARVLAHTGPFERLLGAR